MRHNVRQSDNNRSLQMGSMTLWEPLENHNLVEYFEQLGWRHLCDCTRAALKLRSNFYMYLGLIPHQN